MPTSTRRQHHHATCPFRACRERTAQAKDGTGIGERETNCARREAGAGRDTGTEKGHEPMQQIKLSTDIETVSTIFAREANRVFEERAGVKIDLVELRDEIQTAFARTLGRREGNIIVSVARPGEKLTAKAGRGVA